MNDFHLCALRIIKQIYRVLSYEYEMGITKSRLDSQGIYSLKFLRSLQEHPMEHLHKILKRTESLPNKFELSNEDRQTLIEFFNKMNDMKSQAARRWLYLQHYMHYVYRNFTTSCPKVSNETLDAKFLCEMDYLVEGLREVDDYQLYLRVFSLLREYVTFAYWSYKTNCRKDYLLECLCDYYTSYMNATQNLSIIFARFGNILKEKCNLGWIEFCSYIFFNYFYSKEINHILIEYKATGGFFRTENNALLYEKMETELTELNSLLFTNDNIKFINENSVGIDIIKEHDRVLNKNFWIPRSPEELEVEDLGALVLHLFHIVRERLVRKSDAILGKTGQCLCEDCLIVSLGNLTIEEKEKVEDVARLTNCRYCKSMIALEGLQEHILGHLHKPDKDGTPNKGIDQINDKITAAFVDKFIKTSGSDSDLSKCVLEMLKLSKDNAQAPSPEKPVKKTITKQALVQANLPKLAPINGTSSKPVINDEPKENSKKPPAEKTTLPCGHSFVDEDGKKPHNHKDSKKCDCTYCEVFGSSTHVHQKNETRERLRVRLNERKQLSKLKPLGDKTNVAKPVVRTQTIHRNNTVKPSMPPQPTKLAQPIVKTAPANAKPAVTKPKPENIVQPTAKPIAKQTQSSVKPENKQSTVNTSNKPVVKKPDLPVVNIKNNLDKPQKPESNSPDLINDIHGLLDFIEGTSNNDNMSKKAAKKARQRQKKDGEKVKPEEDTHKKEEDAQKKEEDAKKAEQERLKAIQFWEKCKANKGMPPVQEKISKKKKNKTQPEVVQPPKLVEETIPAMVTIKRVIENGDNFPKITITLRGSTPDQDKLLYTLVNGNDDNKNDNTKSKNDTTKNKSTNDKNDKDKSKKNDNNSKGDTKKNSKDKKAKQKLAKEKEEEKPIERLLQLEVLRNEPNTEGQIKVTLANNEAPLSKKKQKALAAQTEPQKKPETTSGDFSMLRLPPGITITKVNGPMDNKNFRIAMNGVDGGPGGVIVVDTEKLGSQMGNKEIIATPMSKKSKKKKNKAGAALPAVSVKQGSGPMVTLKNPFFDKPMHNPNPAPLEIAGASCQASIFKNKDGMVTIRSSRLQQSMNGGAGTPLADLKPILGEEMATPPSSDTPMSPMSAQELLSGLPGIQITKVEKKNAKNEERPQQTDEVSIIPTANGDTFCPEEDDWLYDSVFDPKDILDDMDAEEKELEAFKRFCQQSVPPKQKEKVAHLNVKDIVLMKKNEKNNV